MSRGFLKFKKRILLDVLIKSFAASLAVGLVSFSVLFVLFKRAIIPMETPLCAVCGAGVAIIVWLITFFVLKPGNQKVARRLDKELSLNEKVQTMVTLEGKEGDMLTLQREDADRRLLDIPARRLEFKHILHYSLVLLLSVALTVGAFAVPVKGAEQPPDEPIQNLTDWQKMALEELIETVKASRLEETAKADVVKDLEALRDKLVAGVTATEMHTSVVTVIVETETLLDTINTYKLISESLKGSSIATVTRLGLVVGRLNNPDFKTELRAVRTQLTEIEAEELTTTLIALASSLDAAINKTEKRDSDMLVNSLTAMRVAVSDINDARGENTDAWAQARLDEAFGAAENEVEVALLQQYYDKDVCNTVKQRLMEIFGVTEADLPQKETDGEEEPDDTDDPYKENDNELNTDGGIGEGGIAMGSDDEFYDHGGAGYTPYSDAEVFGRYEAHLDTLKRDGEVPNELRDMIDRYFTILRTEKDEEEK